MCFNLVGWFTNTGGDSMVHLVDRLDSEPEIGLEDIYPREILEETERTWPMNGHKETVPVLSAHEAMLRREQFDSLVDWVLDPLEKKERQALKLWFLEGKSRSFIAIVLHCNVSEVDLVIASALAKARAAVRS
jgi:DNA-directed RNA polymerase specialized sigma24 family protein